jgi:hypothetical protein
VNVCAECLKSLGTRSSLERDFLSTCLDSRSDPISRRLVVWLVLVNGATTSVEQSTIEAPTCVDFIGTSTVRSCAPAANCGRELDETARNGVKHCDSNKSWFHSET